MLGREPILALDGAPLVDAKGRRSYVTSAGSGPSVGKHLLMAYLPPEHAKSRARSSLVEYFGERYPVTVAVAGARPLFDPDERTDPVAEPRPMNILVCVKRVPETGGRIDADRLTGRRSTPASWASRSARTRNAQSRRRSGSSRRRAASSTVLTLGPDPAADQLRDAMAIGVDRAILLETDGRDWDPSATAAAIVDAIEAEGGGDGLRPAPVRQRGGRQRRLPGRDPGRRGPRAAIHRAGSSHSRSATGWPSAARGAGGGWEVFELPLPAVVAVREGINLPRYPSVPGRLRAKKKEIVRIDPAPGRAA